MSLSRMLFASLLWLLPFCFQPAGVVAAEKPLRVAVSVYSYAPAYMRKWVDDLQEHPAVLDGRVRLHFYNGMGSHPSQHEQFETIATIGYDAIVLVANDLKASKRLLAVADGIPVVASCAPTDADTIDGFIGPDDVLAGYLTAKSVIEQIGGAGNVVILRGPPEQGATQHRDIGIARALAEHPDVTVIQAIATHWSRAMAMQAIQGVLERNVAIDGIIAQNDEMALGAIDLLKLSALPPATVASIDGIDEAVAAVERGDLLQTLRQDSTAEAQGALDLVLRSLSGPGFQPESPAWQGDMRRQWEEGASVVTVPWEVISKDA